MERKDIENTIYAVVAERLEPDNIVEISNSSRFVDDLQIDSMEIVELLFDAEEKFKIQFEDTAARQFQTIGDVVDYIYAKVNDRELAAAET